MKQIQILALFVLSILVVFTSQTNNLQTVNNINRLVGFKCNGVTKLSTPIRLSRSGEIQCFSLDGQNCVYGLNTDDDCRNYVIKNIDKLNPVTCSRDKYESKGHWCKKGFKYFFKTWHCQADTGLNIAVKFNYGRFGVECLSKNGKDCIRGDIATLACQKANTCPKFRARMKILSCGQQHQKYWGHNGYLFPHNHWCKKAFAYFRYTGEYLCKAATGLNTPIRISELGNIQCLSQDGKNCDWSASTNEKCADIVSNNKTPKFVTCGRHLTKLTGKTGFETPLTWCRSAYRALYKKVSLTRGRSGRVLPFRILGGKIPMVGGRFGLPPRRIINGGRFGLPPRRRDGKPQIVGGRFGLPPSRIIKGGRFGLPLRRRDGKPRMLGGRFGLPPRRFRGKIPKVGGRFGLPPRRFNLGNKGGKYGLPPRRIGGPRRYPKGQRRRSRRNRRNRRRPAVAPKNVPVKKILKNLIEKNIKILRNKGYIKRINKWIKRGKINSPAFIQKIIGTLRRHQVRGGKGFWNRFLRRISKGKKVIRLIATQKAILTVRPPFRGIKPWFRNVITLWRKIGRRGGRALKRIRIILRNNVPKRFIKGIIRRLRDRQPIRGIQNWFVNMRKILEVRRIIGGARRYTQTNLVWESGKRATSPIISTNRVMVKSQLPKTFSINIRVNKLSNNGYMCLGVATSPSPTINGYLGMAKGQWSVCGNNVLAENGKWAFTRKNWIKQGDIITIWGSNGRVGFRVNGDRNNGYSFNIGSTNLWFGASLNIKGYEMEILPITGLILKNRIRDARLENGLGLRPNFGNRRITFYTVKKIMNKPYMRRIGRLIKGNVNSPAKALRIKRILISNGILGGNSFWNRLGRNLRDGLRRIARLIAIQKFKPRIINKNLDEITRRNKLMKVKKLTKKIYDNAFTSLTWSNGRRIITTNTNGYNRAYVSKLELPAVFSVNIGVRRLLDNGHMCLGFTTEENPQINGYLGMKTGQWSMCGNNVLAQSGHWVYTSNNWIKEGDIITLWANNGVVGYRINGDKRNAYSFNIGTTRLFFAATLGNGYEFEIINLEAQKLRNALKRVRDFNGTGIRIGPFMRRVTPGMIKFLIKKPYIKRIKNIITKKIDSPKTIQKIRDILRKNKIKGSKYFWNNLIRLIGRKRPFKFIVREIAKQKFVRPRRISPIINFIELPWVRRIRRIIYRGKPSGLKQIKIIARRNIRGGNRFYFGRLWMYIRLGKPWIQIAKSMWRERNYQRGRRIKRLTLNSAVDLKWPGGEIISRPNGNYNRAVIRPQLPRRWSINIKVNNLRNNGYMCLGVTKNPNAPLFGYLGMANGQWSVCGNNVIATEGRWGYTNNNWIKKGDVITIWGNNGKVGYRVNGDRKNTYFYDMKTTKLWFSATLKIPGYELEFLPRIRPRIRNEILNARRINGFGRRIPPFKKVTPTLLNKFIKKPFMKKITNIIKGRITHPHQFQKIRNIINKVGIYGGLGFWNRLALAIKRRRTGKDGVARIIAVQKYERKRKDIVPRRIRIKPWFIEIKRIIRGPEKRSREAFIKIKKIIKVNKVIGGGKWFWENIWRIIRRGLRIHHIWNIIKERKKIIKINKINNIVYSNNIRDLLWTINSSTIIKEYGYNKAFMTNNKLPPVFSINVRVRNLNNNGFMCFGVATSPTPQVNGYLGIRKGQWTMCGNNVLGENGLWKFTNNNWIKKGDIITIWGNNGKVGYKVNGDKTNSYSYNLGTTELYFGATLANRGYEFEIMKDDGKKLENTIDITRKINGIGRKKIGGHYWRRRYTRAYGRRYYGYRQPVINRPIINRPVLNSPRLNTPVTKPWSPEWRPQPQRDVPWWRKAINAVRRWRW